MDQVVIVGSGVSTGIPVIGHLNTGCACVEAMKSAKNKNRRNNVSLLIRRLRGPESPAAVLPPLNTELKEIVDSDNEEEGEKSEVEKRKAKEEKKDQYERKKRDPNPLYDNILIDAGKTFREAYFNVMAPLGVDTLTSLLVTHDHADAMAGMDDMRDLQFFTVIDKKYRCDYYIPTYMSKKTYEVLNSQAAYITRNGFNRGHHLTARSSMTKEQEAEMAEQRKKMLERRSTCLEVYELSDQEPEPVALEGMEGIPFYSFPVFHGGEYRSMAYAFGRGLRFKTMENRGGKEETQQKSDCDVKGDGQCIVYISDVSAVPDNSMEFLLSLEKIDILMVDLLQGPNSTQFSHMCQDQMEALVFKLQPVKAYGIGMYCDLEHEATNKALADSLAAHKATNPESKIEVLECGYDGQAFDLNL